MTAHFTLVLCLIKDQLTEIFVRSFANFSADRKIIPGRHWNRGFTFVFTFPAQGLSMRRDLQVGKLRLRDPGL